MSFVRAVPIALLLALAAPALAHADATLSVSGAEPNKTLTFTVNDTFGHSTKARVQSGRLVIEDDIGMTVGASGCVPIDALRVDCGIAGDFREVAFLFGAGADRLNLDVYLPPFPIAMTVDGGGGDDVLIGGLLDDAIDGGPGSDLIDGIGGDDDLFGEDGNDTIDGGSGIDLLDGGDGNDWLTANEAPPEVDYDVSCGAGEDLVWSYSDGDPIADDCEILDKPRLDGELRITGDLREGSVLALTLPPNIGGDGVAILQWERCDSAGDACDPISVDSTYTLTHADVGHRLRAWYRVENPLGEDRVDAEMTEVIAARPPAPRQPRPPRPTPRPPTPRVDPLKPPIAPLAIVRKPSLAIRNGRPIVDTGRTMACPGVAGGLACRLHLTARPAGASARWRGRPAVAGESGVDVVAGAGARVRFQLGKRAYRLLLAHRKLTLSITATITRMRSHAVKTTFVITIKAPRTRRR